MSSEDDCDAPVAPKRRHTLRACDTCRRRKTRCDGAEMPDTRCSFCLASNLACTYDAPSKSHYPSMTYIQQLEQRLAQMESLLQNQQYVALRDKRSPNSSSIAASLSSALPFVVPPPPSIMSPVPEDVDKAELAHDEPLKLARWLEQLRLDPATPRFHGETASHWLAVDARDLEATFTEPRHVVNNDGDLLHESTVKRRTEFWRVQPWERQGFEHYGAAGHCQTFEFPPDDLLPILVIKYFEEIATIISLLYRPGFERSIQEGLHLRDDGFAHVLLLVCAIGSPFVDDPRVLIDGSPLSSGWRYLHQVPLVRQNLLTPPTLYDLQICCLGSIFMASSSIPQAYWGLLGIGIRMAIDVGVHRKQVYSKKPNIQEEQWKRAFWVLVCLDLHASLGMGRPSAIQSEDFDVDMPLEVDDEYWDHSDPDQAFVQPAGLPSRNSIFGWYLKLHLMMAYTVRTIYSIKKSKALLSVMGPESNWEQKIVSELDSSLNEWVDSVPDHLRWDPNRENMTFFHQSAALWSGYYQLQILVHRPFMPQADKPHSMGLPSLAICLNAARACSRVMEIHQRRKGGPVPIQIPGAFTVGTVLLFNVWSRGRNGIALDPAKEMADVHRCMYVLKQAESRYPLAGRFWDVLSSLASTSSSRSSTYQPLDANKRKRPEGGASTQARASVAGLLSVAGPLWEAPEPTQVRTLHTGWVTAGFTVTEPPTRDLVDFSLPAGSTLSSGSYAIGGVDMSTLNGERPEPNLNLPAYDITVGHLPDSDLSSPIDPPLGCTSYMTPTFDIGMTENTVFSQPAAMGDPNDDWDTFFKNVAKESTFNEWGMT